METYNASTGELTDFDCAICKNKGYIAKRQDGRVFYQDCKCKSPRRATKLIRQSGITDRRRFVDIVPQEWQASIIVGATKYLSTTDAAWLYIGGQVGSGKTMIATALINELLARLSPCHYMQWRNDVVNLKANVNEAEAYKNAITPLKTIPVLYIDDLFKTERGKRPTQADINIAFEILNSRYNNPMLQTVITSEYNLMDILDIDEAVGSRIYERCRNFNFYISRDDSKNYRLR